MEVDCNGGASMLSRINPTHREFSTSTSMGENSRSTMTVTIRMAIRHHCKLLSLMPFSASCSLHSRCSASSCPEREMVIESSIERERERAI